MLIISFCPFVILFHDNQYYILSINKDLLLSAYYLDNILTHFNTKLENKSLRFWANHNWRKFWTTKLVIIFYEIGINIVTYTQNGEKYLRVIILFLSYNLKKNYFLIKMYSFQVNLKRFISILLQNTLFFIRQVLFTLNQRFLFFKQLYKYFLFIF